MSTASIEPSPSPPSPSLSNHSSNVMMSSNHLISTNSVVGGITSVPNNSVAITNQTNNAISNGTSIKYGTLVPNRIFVGGISSTTTEADLHKLFSAFGNVKATKIISDRGGCSKGYGFVTFETEEEAKKLQAEADNIILKERKLNIAPAIKKQPYTRTYEMGQPVMNGALYYHNGIPYTYQNGVALFQDGVIGPANPNASSQNSAAAAAALAAANSQIPPGAFMIPHAMAAAATQQQQQQQQAAAAAMFLPAANSAAAAAAAQQFSTYQQQAAAVAALQQQQQQISGVGPQTSSCSTTNSSSISGTTNGNAPWRWVSQASSNPVTNGHGGGHGTSSPVTPHHQQQQQMAFQQVQNEGQPPSTPTLFYNSGSSIVNPAPGYASNGISLVANNTSYTLGPDGLWYGYHIPGNGTSYVATPTWDATNSSPKDLGYVSMNANDTTGSSFNFNSETTMGFEGSVEPSQPDSGPPEKSQGDEIKIGSTSSSSYVPTTPSYLYSAPPQYAPPVPQMPYSPAGWNYVPREGTFGMNTSWTMPAPGIAVQDPQTSYRGNLKARHDNDVRKMSYELQSGVRNGPKKYDGIKGHSGSSRNSSVVPGSSAGSFDNNGYGLLPMWSDMNNNNSHHRENSSSYNRSNHRGTRSQDYSRPPVPLLSRGGSLLGRPLQYDSTQGRANPKFWFNNNNNNSNPGRRPPNSNTFRKSENRRGGQQYREMSDHNVGVCHVCPAHSPTKQKSAHRPSSFGANLKNSKAGGKTGVDESGKAD
ncbi:E3 ubiquitin-protein ligase RBBP6-like isoform X2 [Tigriopus californicus]|uniref:E3 ubiquitin-protein ligase RBBP6-like isoform X2 n=1 Tax=Tigriopus californicus TaxID=6832 RepID=UPI0027DAA59B|nr:E3 ubiquitin-protein ligase RBBP6-like isoform X2 [Tigriopus californicus]